jgi:transposase-like protein
MRASSLVVARAHDGGVGDDVDPAARPRPRRSFSPEYKLGILEEYDALSEPGARGALLRREGLYSSHIVEWRRARDVGALEGLARHGRPRRSPAEVEADRLRRDNERLRRELTKTKAALDIMGKAHALLEALSESADTETPPPR